MIFAPISGMIRSPVSSAIGAIRGISPAVLHNFYAATLDGANLARPSTSTRFNSAGLQVTEAANVACFDYDPATGVLRGVLDEAAATNLLLRSSDYSATWFSSNVTPTPNTTDVPDPTGGNSATKFVVGASAGALGQGVTSTAVQHDGSIWLRSGSGALDASLTIYRNSPYALVATKNVTLSALWQRFDVAGLLVDATTHNFQVGFGINKTVYAWGAQLEVGTFPTSNIPTTTTAAATRAAVTLTTTLPFACDVLVQDRNGGYWMDNQPAGTLMTVPRAGQRHVGIVTAYAVGVLSPNSKAAMAVTA